MIKYRYYQENDYLELISVLKEANLYDEIRESKENLIRKIKRNNKSILIAENEDKKLVGCIFIMEDGRNAFLWRLAVKIEYRNKGIGKNLIKKAENIAKELGYKEVGGFVDSKNDKLQKRYKKQKYKTTSQYTFIYKPL